MSRLAERLFWCLLVIVVGVVSGFVGFNRGSASTYRILKELDHWDAVIDHLQNHPEEVEQMQREFHEGDGGNRDNSI